jgi:HEAT repeat protein/VWA domain-containing protein
MNNVRRLCLLPFLLAVLATGWSDQPAQAQDAAWVALKGDYERLFRPPPVDRMFTDPLRELKISRRAPFSAPARAEIAKTRAKVTLRRAQILNDRRHREGVVSRLGRYGGLLASATLIDAHTRQLANIKIAKAALARHREALTIDINPGVDPGGLYWERWMTGKAYPAARSLLADEIKIRDLVVEACARIRTPVLLEWFARNTRSHAQSGVRERMARALVLGGKTEDVNQVGSILGGEKRVWARASFLDALGARGGPAATPFVLGALGDPEWPVRSAAIAAMRALGRRDIPAIDALLASLQIEQGRLRLEFRDALAEATGQSFGLAPEPWKTWWAANREGWTPPEEPATVPPLTEELPRLFGIPTASHRIAILVSSGSHMMSPVTRRPVGNGGEPSPRPEVDTALKIAAWEILEGLGTLPKDAQFTVIVYGAKPVFWSRKLKPARKGSVKSARGFVSKFEPDGGSNLNTALLAALRMGITRKVDDIALAGAGDVDTIFVVGSAWSHKPPKDSNGVPRIGGHRLGRLRRVAVHSVSGSLAKMLEALGKEK